MSKSQTTQILQNQYNAITQALGDAHYKRKQLTTFIQNLEAQLEHLDSVSLPLLTIKDNLNQAQKPATTKES